MDVAGHLAQRLFVPFYERRWGIHDASLGEALKASERIGIDEIRDRQLREIQDLMQSSLRDVPLYRERAQRAGMQAGDLKSLDDFARWPLLQKEDIRERGEDLLADGMSREQLFHKRTGGSTGVPVHVYWDARAHRFKRALVKRHDRWAGYQLGMRLAALWGDTDKHYPLKEAVYRALCLRTTYLDTLVMNDATMMDFVERLRRQRPTVLMGHAHSIYFFTQFLVEHGVDDIGFEGIISTAENLVPSEREAIEARFGKVLFDRYGCEEVSLIASECETHDGLHQAAESVYVEVLDGDDETPGRLVVTDLQNRAFPLIRYEVGDLATVRSGACACGRGLPRLGRVFGRSTDILYTPDGRRISGVSILDTFVIHVEGVKQAQIVQDALEHVEVRVVGDKHYSPATEARLAELVKEVFGVEMRHTLVPVDAIAPTRRGKFQFTICEIEEDGSPKEAARGKS